MGSIGYIGGNIGYIGTGTLNMDYPYEHGTAHYQLWKPPGSYFARGEAPPPYEEAIALAQAESLNTCTVSVATSTQRQYPIAITETEASQTITANTTNLINININNGGNLTAIATGENHVLGNELATNLLHENAQIDSSNVNITNDSINNHESCMSFPTSYYTMPVSASEVCTNQNCDLNLGNNCNYSLSNNPNVKEAQVCFNQNTPSISSATMPKDRASERFTETCDNANRTILPPPIFDSIANESNTASEDIAHTAKLRQAGKRYHRTIPRQFATVDPIINPLKHNRNNIVTVTASTMSCHTDASGKTERMDSAYNGAKRLSCQCPVQHMPMSYLSSHSVGMNNEAASALSNGSGRVVSIKKRFLSDVARHANTPHHTAMTQPKPIQVSNGHCKGTLKKSHENIECSERTVYSNASYVKLHHAATASTDKPVDEQSLVDNQIIFRKQNSLSKKSAYPSSSNAHLSSILKNSLTKSEQDCSSYGADADISTIVQPSISNDHEMHRKTISSSKPNSCIEQNPELPPKMYKHNNARSSGTPHKSYYSNSKTHTFSKPSNDNPKFSIPTTNSAGFAKSVKLQKYNYSKSLPRNIISASHEYAQVNKSTTQSFDSSDSLTTNINYNTLPKKTSKLSTRSSNLLTEVVNKVPSVINIPSPLQPPPLLPVCRGVPSSMDIAAMQVQRASIISNNKRLHQSASKRSANSTSGQDTTYKSIGVNMPENAVKSEKPLPVLTTSTNCANPKEHFLPNDNSLDDDYLSECENCKSAHGSRYYLEEEIDDAPQETMTLQRKMPENEEDQQSYYRVSSTLPTNTSRKTPTIKTRETWFTTIPASSSSEEEEAPE